MQSKVWIQINCHPIRFWNPSFFSSPLNHSHHIYAFWNYCINRTLNKLWQSKQLRKRKSLGNSCVDKSIMEKFKVKQIQIFLFTYLYYDSVYTWNLSEEIYRTKHC